MTRESVSDNVVAVESLIHTIRGQRVILDADLARIYGMHTKRLNEQVRRNVDRFPADFVFQIAPQEAANLRSQIATSSLQPSDNVVVNFERSQFATGSHGGLRYHPFRLDL